MAFPPSFIDELVARNPIEDVVGQYVNLKRSGANMFGLCPFHGEKTASFKFRGNNVDNCLFCGVGCCADNTLRFVEHDIDMFFCRKVISLYIYVINIGVNKFFCTKAYP